MRLLAEVPTLPRDSADGDLAGQDGEHRTEAMVDCPLGVVRVLVVALPTRTHERIPLRRAGQGDDMRIAVIGASGNVGTALLRRLDRAPEVDEVLGVCRRPPEPTDATGPLHRKVHWKAADITRADLAPDLAGVDVLVHLAWLLQPSHQPARMYAVNVDGSRRVFRAAVAAGVPAIVDSSSVGAYAPGPKDRRVDESWPTTGIATSVYSRHKAIVERMLDGVVREHPAVRVARMRPGVVLQPGAASEIGRYFLGPLVLAHRLVDPRLLPVLPLPSSLALQAVHADDLADAFFRVVTNDVHGGVNVAGEPVLDRSTIARTLGARPLPLPRQVARAAVDLSWRLHVQPTDPGWLDLGTRVPLMSVDKVRALGWQPSHDVTTALHEVLDGLRTGTGSPTPVLRPLAARGGKLGAALRGFAGR